MQEQKDAALAALAESNVVVRVGMLAEVLDSIKKMFRRDRDLLADLQKRVDALEATPIQYDGPHEQGKSYVKGTFVTHDGSLWHCNRETTSRPGDGPAWTLAVKRGRDAR